MYCNFTILKVIKVNTEKTQEIFSGTLWEAEVLKNLLNDYGINCFLKHNTLTSYALDPIQANNIKIIVLEKDYDKAKEIVNDFFHTY